MTGVYNIESLTFEKDTMCLKVDGQLFRIPIRKVSKKLTDSDEIQRNFFTISPSGYGIHWPLIDEDLSVEFLLKAI